jgi:hypothetical protein
VSSAIPVMIRNQMLMRASSRRTLMASLTGIRLRADVMFRGVNRVSSNPIWAILCAAVIALPHEEKNNLAHHDDASVAL